MRLWDRWRKRRRQGDRKAGIWSSTDRHREEKNVREQAREVVGEKRLMPIRTKNWKRKKRAVGCRRETEDEKKEGEGAGQRHIEKKKEGKLEDRERWRGSRREGERRAEVKGNKENHSSVG